MHESLLERERLEHDLKLAEQVQKRFLPQAVPKVAGWEFFAHYDPAYEVGGDYYDFVPLPNQRLALALGDVSGKGVAAALMMAKFSGDTRFCMLSQSGPGAAAAELNRLLYAAGIEEKFITLSLGVIDLARRCLTLASAGHLPLLVRRADGRVEEIGEEITGFPLGILPESSYRQLEVTLQPGDIAMMYSDGVTDPRNIREELYDSKVNRRLLKRLAESSGGPRGRRPLDPPGHSRVLHGPLPDRRHHPRSASVPWPGEGWKESRPCFFDLHRVRCSDRSLTSVASFGPLSGPC